MLKLKEIAYIMVYVSDLEKAVRFYRDVLGLELMWKESGQGHAAVATSAGPLVLRLKDASLYATPADGPVIAFEVEDIHACFAELKEQQVGLREGPEEHTGRFTLRFRDPFGNPIELNQTKSPHPSTRLRASAD